MCGVKGLGGGLTIPPSLNTVFFWLGVEGATLFSRVVPGHHAIGACCLSNTPGAGVPAFSLDAALALVVSFAFALAGP